MAKQNLRRPVSCAALVLGLGCMLLAVPAAVAQPAAEGTVTLRPVVAEGEKWTVTTERNLGVDLETTDNEGQKSRQTLVSNRTTRFAREVLAATDGKPVRVKLTFILAKLSQTRSGQAQVKTDTLPLEGKVVQLEGQGGSLRRQCLNDPSFAEDKMVELSVEEGYERLLPPGPVKLGETWNPEGSDAARFLIGSFTVAPKEASIRCTLDEVKEEGAHKVAIVSVSLEVTGRSGGTQGSTAKYDLEAKLAGRLEFLVDTGKPRLLRLSGRVTSTGDEAGPRGEPIAHVESNGNLSFSVLYETE